MSREIKFRVWDGKMYHYSDLLIPRNINGKGPNEYLLFEKKLVFQQFTGSSDENGREIFEGDILKRTYDVDCFKMSDGTTLEGCIPGNLSITKANFNVVEWKDIGFDLGGVSRIGWYQKSPPRVVGNIFENPELLTNEP